MGYHFSRIVKEYIQSRNHHRVYLWVFLALFLLAAIVIMIILLRRRKRKRVPGANTVLDIKAVTNDENLMQRICELMDRQQLYLKKDLKVTDVADALNTNRTYISNCIRNQRDCSFSQFVNVYRVEHAKMLLYQHPDKKILEVGMASGFLSESTFFRAFKAITGMTPKDWMAGE